MLKILGSVLLVIFLIALLVVFIAVSCFDITSFEEVKEPIIDSQLERIIKKFKKAKEKKSFYKQVRVLKQLLNKKLCSKEFGMGVIEFKTERCGFRYFSKRWLKTEIMSMWDMATSHRQLFSTKEQKVIDNINKELEKALEREEARKKVKIKTK